MIRWNIEANHLKNWQYLLISHCNISLDYRCVMITIIIVVLIKIDF